MVTRFFACFLLCLLLAPPVRAEAWKVVPGSNVGPLTLGTDYKPYDAILTRTELIKYNQPWWVRFKEGIELHLEGGKVLEVLVHKSSFPGHSGPVTIECERGLKIGDTVPAMEAAYGTGYTARTLKTGSSEPPQSYYAYTNQGIAFQTRGGLIYIIIIWPKR